MTVVHAQQKITKLVQRKARDAVRFMAHVTFGRPMLFVGSLAYNIMPIKAVRVGSLHYFKTTTLLKLFLDGTTLIHIIHVLYNNIRL